MSSRQDVSIPCGTLTLEGVLEIPDSGENPSAAAVLCHPHPMFGGNMHNNVVRALKKGLYQRGLICLRFNFRGTGQSWGTHDSGIGEIDDVLASIDFLQGLEQVDSERLIVAGYSFGCWVGLRAAARDPRPKRLIGISPPVDSYDFSFLEDETRPKLLIAGDNDFVCSLERFENLLDRIPEPKKGVILPGADHFHVGGEAALIRETDAFLDTFPFEGA
jgi:alpha/beta superfamily hydrolase